MCGKQTFFYFKANLRYPKLCGGSFFNKSSLQQEGQSFEEIFDYLYLPVIFLEHQSRGVSDSLTLESSKFGNLRPELESLITFGPFSTFWGQNLVKLACETGEILFHHLAFLSF